MRSCPGELLADLEAVPADEVRVSIARFRRDLTMCGSCTGLGRVLLPGRREPVRCPACHGDGVR